MYHVYGKELLAHISIYHIVKSTNIGIVLKNPISVGLY